MHSSTKEYISAARVTELVSWACEDPLICENAESNERLVRSWVKFWSKEEKRWIRPNNTSRERIIRAALTQLRHVDKREDDHELHKAHVC